MKNTAYLLLLFVLISCNSVKRSQNNLFSGNYDETIRLSIKKLKKTNNAKKRKQHINLLEQAYEKAVARNTDRIDLLEKENNPENAKEIYDNYLDLDYRQRLIRPLLPLENASFDIKNYNDEIVKAKNNYASYLYEKGSNQLSNANTVLQARTAHGYLAQLKQLLPNYKSDLDSLLTEAHYRGTDFVYVTIQNRTEQVIPKRLEQAILDFDTYKLDDFWTEYHAKIDADIDYNYGIILDIREILVSPERISDKEFTRRKEVNDGWKYEFDSNGNVKKDSLGNDIKVDVFKKLRANVIVTTQSKSALVGGDVVYRDLKENRTISKFPIASEFVFENIFAGYKGDKGALTKEDRRLLRSEYIEFPSNEQMVFDTSTDLKNKFSQILRRKKFR